MPRRTVTAVLAVALLTVLAVTGCGRGPGIGNPVLPDTSAEEYQQALEALARWDTAVQAAGGLQGFIPVGELTTQVGDWEPANGENKLALLSGAITLSTGDASMAASTMTVAGGAPRPVRTVTASEAVARMRAAGSPCGGCGATPPLEVVAARPTSTSIETTRGPATVPAWEFTLAGTDVKLVHVAVALGEGVPATPPPWDSTHPPAGMSIDKATVEPGGRRLTVTFVGAHGPASESCGADYSARAVESKTAVVVLITVTAHVQTEEPPDGVAFGCAAIGYLRQATVDLAAPLDDRAVLEVRTGQPVPVTYRPSQ